VGDEARSEVTASRIVWAGGYRQPPTYHLPRWRARQNGREEEMPAGRFRPKLDGLDSEGSWSWQRNPFVGTQAFRGLIVLMMVLNSTDLKDDNNGIFEVTRDGPGRRALVRREGPRRHARGDRHLPSQAQRRGRVRETPVHRARRDERVRFHFRGRHRWLLRDVSPDDVRWLCDRLDRLTEEQWRDAFRAGGYSEDETTRYIAGSRRRSRAGRAIGSAPQSRRSRCRHARGVVGAPSCVGRARVPRSPLRAQGQESAPQSPADLPAAAAAAQAEAPAAHVANRADGHVHWDLYAQIASLGSAVTSMPLAAALGAMLAFRPRRRGTPPRSAPVIHTQIILAIVGAVVMLVVGASLARAFGIVGAASLIRYRAKIDDPKDAGVMLSALSIGLASGVGLYALAMFGTVFVLAVLWIVESFEPERHKAFMLTVATRIRQPCGPSSSGSCAGTSWSTSSGARRRRRSATRCKLPLERRTDRLSNAILALTPDEGTAVEWEEKKVK
jgi:hypothetical protein